MWDVRLCGQKQAPQGPLAAGVLGARSMHHAVAAVARTAAVPMPASDWASPLPATRAAACRTTHHHPHPAHAPLTSHVQAPFWQVVPLLQHVHAVHLENGPFLLVQQHVCGSSVCMQEK